LTTVSLVVYLLSVQKAANKKTISLLLQSQI